MSDTASITRSSPNTGDISPFTPTTKSSVQQLSDISRTFPRFRSLASGLAPLADYDLYGCVTVLSTPRYAGNYSSVYEGLLVPTPDMENFPKVINNLKVAVKSLRCFITNEDVIKVSIPLLSATVYDFILQLFRIFLMNSISGLSSNTQISCHALGLLYTKTICASFPSGW